MSEGIKDCAVSRNYGGGGSGAVSIKKLDSTLYDGICGELRSQIVRYRGLVEELVDALSCYQRDIEDRPKNMVCVDTASLMEFMRHQMDDLIVSNNLLDEVLVAARRNFGVFKPLELEV